MDSELTLRSRPDSNIIHAPISALADRQGLARRQKQPASVSSDESFLFLFIVIVIPQISQRHFPDKQRARVIVKVRRNVGKSSFVVDGRYFQRALRRAQ
jgi:hypothetical protein